MPNTLHVVSHTHWDREWYLTFQQFRMRLVDLIDQLLDLLERDPAFLSFHLDAQTIVLEDYLEIKPYNRQKIEAYVRAGRIIIGPWYQLNDEFLTSGEATIRSLLAGVRIARQFGRCASIGYLPDQFGNLSQMPQIFRGFGIDNAIMGRGYQLAGDRKMEFLWEAPDGSSVTASLMAFWYNNAQRFPADSEKALGYTEALQEKMTAHSISTHLLLMNGVDHLEAQQDLSPILAAVQQRLPAGDRIVHSTVEQYIRAVKAEVADQKLTLQKQVGELRDDRNGSCLAGTLSARMYIKQANHHAQITLEKYAEPFATFAMQTGAPYPQDFLQYAWKLLMKNHPHDSICGCSIDAVHREMMPRFAQVEQIGGELIKRALRPIANRAALAGESDGEGAAGLVVFNPLNWARTDPARAALVFPLGEPARGNPQRDDRRRAAGFTITDAQGNEIPFALTGAVEKVRQVLSPVELPLDQWVQEFTVEFIAENVPACGYKTYRVSQCAAMPQYEVWESAFDAHWQPVFEDGGDTGDEYLYRKPAHDRRLELPACGPNCIEERSAVRHTRVFTASWELPKGATPDLSSRSQELAACQVTTRVTHWRGCPRTEFTTTIDNRARDHRLRVVFQNHAESFHPEPYSIAEGQFDVLYRPLVHPLESEGAAPYHPQQNWVALAGNAGNPGDTRTITVINHGLPEYEIYPEAPGIAVTLLRCVNALSRRDDGPEIETPEAQCQGEHTFQYAFMETQGDWKSGLVWRQAQQFNAPLYVLQTGPHAGQGERDLPAALSFITVEPEQLVVTAIKRAEDEPGRVILRFFNITDQAVTGGRVRVHNARSAEVVNLNEEPQEPLELHADGTAMLKPIRPKEIATLAFRI